MLPTIPCSSPEPFNLPGSLLAVCPAPKSHIFLYGLNFSRVLSPAVPPFQKMPLPFQICNPMDGVLKISLKVLSVTAINTSPLPSLLGKVDLSK